MKPRLSVIQGGLRGSDSDPRPGASSADDQPWSDSPSGLGWTRPAVLILRSTDQCRRRAMGSPDHSGGDAA